jgi:hypothetical protein
MRFKLNPLSPNGLEVFGDTIVYSQTSSTTESGSSTPLYITYGTNGITYFRMETPSSGQLWDAYIDSTGHWVTTAVTASGGADIFGLLLLRNLA